MYLEQQQLVLSPTDLVGHLACEHLTTLEHAAALGHGRRPAAEDPNAAVIRRLGEAHEQAVLADLRAVYRVVEIPTSTHPADAEARTVAAMRDGADRIYQATLYDGRWRGHADFLVRNDDRPSDLGGWSYDVADTKLARHLAVGALVQMGVYAGPARLRRAIRREPRLKSHCARRARDTGVLWQPDRYCLVSMMTPRSAAPWPATCAGGTAKLTGWCAPRAVRLPSRHCAN